ncbi:hypothetical protein FJU31_02365 [Stenotrophomonas cyclobalanopsidis]|uniref:Uncharacterized protein n=1 Tax=Stenotrophomonas cyclobalanopsidis TaxID=2771362 RepID=A0ABQ6T4T1_9GAMM|nr:hypothetical protein C1926_04195 [Stenotrophomonas sp. ZAC14A_NAIMI4_1]KAA9003724.1 hypothetical protein FJU31_02365 [Stenotrophomonas cyclobalanopsidis]
MRAIALLQLNSAYGSCRARSCAASVLDAGNIGMMFRGVGRSRPGWQSGKIPEMREPEKLQKGTIYAG